MRLGRRHKAPYTIQIIEISKINSYSKTSTIVDEIAFIVGNFVAKVVTSLPNELGFKLIESKPRYTVKNEFCKNLSKDDGGLYMGFAKLYTDQTHVT